MVHADFALALAGLCTQSTAFDTTIVNAKSSIVAEARNRCVELAREHAADHLLFLDSDMIFPRTTLERLMAHKKAIVGATYAKRVAPFSALGAALENGRVENGGGLIEMRHIPTGCLLIQMSVFETLGEPGFRFSADPITGAIVGEDYDFCNRALAAGIPVWCDTKLSFEIGHIGQTVVRLPQAQS
jgi:hypothetical protein